MLENEGNADVRHYVEAGEHIADCFIFVVFVIGVAYIIGEYANAKEVCRNVDTAYKGDVVGNLEGEDKVSHQIEILKLQSEHADEMDREANTDALTKAKNKRAYDIKSRLMSKANHEYGVVLLDINGLKSINDNYGHKNGDICIKTVCRVRHRLFSTSRFQSGIRS